MINFFRYKKTTIIVILGFVISIFVFQFYVAAKKIEQDETHDIREYLYKTKVGFILYSESLSLDDIELFYKKSLRDCNLSIVDQFIYYNSAAAYYLTDISIYDNGYKYPLEEGHYPTNEELNSNIPCVVLGKKMKPFTFRKGDMDFIEILGEDYLVTGYISAENSGIFDYRSILYYSNLGENAKEYIDYVKYVPGWNLFLESDSKEINDLKMYLSEFANEIILLTDYSDVNQEYRFIATEKVDKRYLNMSKTVYLFSILMNIFIFEYWMICRQKEIAIKKAIGYSNISIIICTFFELFIFVCLSVFIEEILMFFLNSLNIEIVNFKINKLTEQLVIVIRYLVITLPLICIIPFFKIIKYTPIDLLNKR